MPHEIAMTLLWGAAVIGVEDKPAGAGAAHPGRRLSDRVLSVFHAACDERELEAAAQLLQVFERLVTRGTPTADTAGRRDLEALVAAHERL
jgi:hypothetical protein